MIYVHMKLEFLSLSYSVGVLPNGDISEKLVFCNERKIWYFRNYRKNESHNLLTMIKYSVLFVY